MNLKNIVIASVLVIVILSGGLIWWLNKRQPVTGTNNDSTPIIFYQKGIVTQFDSAGNPYGWAELWRQDGLNGTARKIYEIPQIVYLVSSNYQFTDNRINLAYDKTYNPFPADDKDILMMKVALDLNGNVISSQEISSTDQNSSASGKIISPNQEYGVTTDILCNETNSEGPCSDDVSLTITNFSDSTETMLTGKDLEFDGSVPAMSIKALGFSADSQNVYALISNQMELGLQEFVKVTIADRRVEVIEKNDGVAAQPNWFLNFLEIPSDSFDLLFSRLNKDQTSDIVRYYTSTNTSDELATISRLGTIYPNSAATGATISRDYDQGADYIDFVTDQVTRLVDSGEFVSWSDNGEYFAWLHYATSNGLGPKAVTVQNRLNGESKVIFDQTVIAQEAQNVNAINAPTAELGSVIYSWVGIK